MGRPHVVGNEGQGGEEEDICSSKSIQMQIFVFEYYFKNFSKRIFLFKYVFLVLFIVFFSFVEKNYFILNAKNTFKFMTKQMFKYRCLGFIRARGTF